MADERKTEQEMREKVWELVRDIKVCTLVTQAGTTLRARPMVAVTSETYQGELWFFTRADSGKVQEIQGNAQVLLSYSEPADQNYVSIAGQADIVRDRALIADKWREPMRTWFPQGKDDPSIALIRVLPDGAEYWDAPSSTLVYAYGYAKARLTGQAPDPGEHGDVAM